MSLWIVEDSRRAGLRIALSRVETNLGEYRRALESALAALGEYERLADSRGLARAHFRVGACHDGLAE